MPSPVRSSKWNNCLLGNLFDITEEIAWWAIFLMWSNLPHPPPRPTTELLPVMANAVGRGIGTYHPQCWISSNWLGLHPANHLPVGGIQQLISANRPRTPPWSRGFFLLFSQKLPSFFKPDTRVLFCDGLLPHDTSLGSNLTGPDHPFFLGQWDLVVCLLASPFYAVALCQQYYSYSLCMTPVKWGN